MEAALSHGAFVHLPWTFSTKKASTSLWARGKHGTKKGIELDRLHVESCFKRVPQRLITSLMMFGKQEERCLR